MPALRGRRGAADRAHAHHIQLLRGCRTSRDARPRHETAPPTGRGDATALPRERRQIPKTHETFALMLGLTRQTLSLALKAMAATGAFSLPYARIVIESAET